MNFRTESFDLPQNEQRRCLSLDMARIAERVVKGCRKVTPPPAVRQVVLVGVTAAGMTVARGVKTLSISP